MTTVIVVDDILFVITGDDKIVPDPIILLYFVTPALPFLFVIVVDDIIVIMGDDIYQFMNFQFGNNSGYISAVNSGSFFEFAGPYFRRFSVESVCSGNNKIKNLAIPTRHFVFRKRLHQLCCKPEISVF